MTVDVAVPVYDEEDDLERSVRRLDGFLAHDFPWPARITIVDNASRDRTWEIARRLATELPRVEALHLDEKGRGRALRAAWSRSDATVVAYMDVDLSTDLRALLPLVAPLLSGHSDIDWVDDPDSRVDLVATALADLRGIARIRRRAAPVRATAPASVRVSEPAFPHRDHLPEAEAG